MLGSTSNPSGRQSALPGSAERMKVPELHFVTGRRIVAPFPPGLEQAVFALGCFWGAERRFWQLPGVYSTAVGYLAGTTRNPSYREVCSGVSGHAEAVLVVFDPAELGFEALLRAFWESHDPTQGMRQGNDVGSQYRSGVYAQAAQQLRLAEQSRDMYQAELSRAGYGPITTEICAAPEFYYAEEYHQQYLAKNPGGYCGLRGTSVSYPLGMAV